MKDFKVAGFPLPLYVLILALTAACMFTGCVPKSLVPAFLVLMVFGEGLNAIGNNVPVVKTYLGGSVICILGSAVLAAGGLIPEQTIETLDYFVNDSGFLIFYIAALICGSLFNIDRNLLLRATVKLLPVAVISLSMGILLSGIMGIILGEGFWGGILYIGVPMTSGGMTAMQYAYNGLDIVQIRRWTEEIRETTAEDQKEAARIIRRLLEEAWIVTTGNQTAIEMDRDCFDRIRDFRSKMAE